MATTSSLQSLHQSPFLSPPQSHFPTNPFSQKLSFSISSFSSPFLSLTTTFSLVTPTSTSATSFDALADYLANSDYRRADEETRRLLIALAGEAAQKRGYVFFSEVQFISASDLRAIDDLWKAQSGGRFGYRVQKRIWEKKAKRDFTQFFIKVRWMKKLDTEVEQWNYRSFPDEFIWEVKEGESFPEGHLPLTNALRGTQLLASILAHPAFKEEEKEDESEGGYEEEEESKLKPKVNLLGGARTDKTDYSF